MDGANAKTWLERATRVMAFGEQSQERRGENGCKNGDVNGGTAGEQHCTRSHATIPNARRQKIYQHIGKFVPVAGVGQVGGIPNSKLHVLIVLQGSAVYRALRTDSTTVGT